MATLEENINQAISDLDKIKAAIEEKGVAVPYDTDTSEYGKLIKDIPSYDTGHAKGLTDFQNMLSRDGQRGVYTNVFQGADFSGFTFNPTVYPTSLGSVFYNYGGAEFPKGIDFSKVNNTESVTDTSKIPYQMFAYCRLQECIPDMNIPIQYRYTNTFAHCYAKKIEILRVAETTIFGNTFNDCPNLKEVTFEGTIGKNISFSSSGKLTDACIDHIIDHLKDLTGQTSATISWHSTVSGKLSDEQITKIFNKNWISD